MLKFLISLFLISVIAVTGFVRDEQIIWFLEITGIDLTRDQFFMIADPLMHYGKYVAIGASILWAILVIFWLIKMPSPEKDGEVNNNGAKSKLSAAMDSIVAKLFGWKWPLNDFARGWIILGKTGSGKSASGFMNLLTTVMQNANPKNGQKPWGGLLLDNKISLFLDFVRVFKYFGREDDIVVLQTRPSNAKPDWKPKYRYNFLSYPGIPASTLAKIIVDTGDSVGGGSGSGGSSNFWRTQAVSHISQAISFLRCTQEFHKIGGEQLIKDLSTDDQVNLEMLSIYNRLPKFPSMSGVYHLIMDIESLTLYIRVLGHIIPNRKDIPDKLKKDYQKAIEHFKINFIRKSEQNAELLDNLQSTMQNYLSFFQNEDIEEVFCQEENSFDFQDIDNGKFFTVVMPQKYQVERKFIFVFFKLLYYYHGLLRGDDRPALKDKNLLILWMDEAQELVTSTKDGTSDFTFSGQAREYRATIVMGTQSIDALVSAGLPENDVQTMLSNISNILCFQASTPKTAKFIEESYPVIEKKERSSKTNGKITYAYKKEAIFTANQLQNMRKFQCVLTHCEKNKPKKLMMKPLMPDGSVAFFYHWKINPLYWFKKFIQTRKFRDKKKEQPEEEEVVDSFEREQTTRAA